MNKLQYDTFLKKVPKPYTYTDYFKWHEHELTSTLLFCPLGVHTKIELSSIIHETSEAFPLWTKSVENKWQGYRVPLGERKLDCILTKEPQNYISHLCDMGLPCSKLNNSNLLNDRNIICAVSKRNINII